MFGSYFHITVHHQRKSGQGLKEGRNLEAGADAEAMEGAADWLAPHGLLSLLSYRTRDSTTHNGLSSPPSISNEEKALQPDLMEAVSWLRFLPFR